MISSSQNLSAFVCYDDVYDSEVFGCGADGLLPAPQDCERRWPVATIPEPGVLWGRRREQRVFSSVHGVGGKYLVQGGWVHVLQGGIFP